MKRPIVIFLSTVLLGLLAVPAAHIMATPNRDAIQWTDKAFLYNMDFASNLTARTLYPLGISTVPKKVIVGRDEWLYLGDEYEKTLSVDRRPPTSTDVEVVKQISAATDAWDAYLASKGVKLFRIMIGPNKGSIYPEHMPHWARPASPNATDALLATASKSLYIDLKTPLLAAKAAQAQNLYFKTDTHWNNFGAGIAFHTFAQQAGAAAPDLRWPADDAYALSGISPRKGGDLANLLRISENLTDSDLTIHAQEQKLDTTQTDYDTKKLLNQGGNPFVGASTKPLLVESPRALNHKKVLWLRDSFGYAMSPLMAATFSDVLQLNWLEAIKPGGRLVQLVEEWKPDYVFFTVVERSSRVKDFANFPPSSGGNFQPTRTTTPIASHDMVDGPAKNNHHISGDDPYIEYALSDAVTPADAHFLSLDLSCLDGAKSVPLQLFWLDTGLSRYEEEHSAHFWFAVDQKVVDLDTLPGWKSAGSIRKLRLDIDAPNVCTRFTLSNPSLGLSRPGAAAKL